jgi:hypothetical protein
VVLTVTKKVGCDGFDGYCIFIKLKKKFQNSTRNHEKLTILIESGKHSRLNRVPEIESVLKNVKTY